MSDTNLSSVTQLKEHNFSTWKPEISALLRAKGLYRIVNGTAPSSPNDDADKIATYQDKQDKAAILILVSASISRA